MRRKETRETAIVRWAIGICACAAVPAVAVAYTGGPVQGGAAIAGKVVFSGTAPAPTVFTVPKEHAKCGTSKKSEEVVVGAGGALANVIVFLEAVSSGKPATPGNLVVDQKSCVYVPHVQAAVQGSTVEFRNSDPVLHNAHGRLDGAKDVANLAMPIQGQRIPIKLKKVGTIDLKCDAGHTWMSGFIKVFDHPYFAVTGADGSFTISDVPAGTYKLVAWHEKLGTQTQPVTVAAAGAKAMFTFK